MGKEHPVTLNTKQKLIAQLLAVGLSAREVAKEAHVSETYVSVLSKGSLFQFEIDEAREKLVGKKFRQHLAKVVDELPVNLARRKQIRDNAERDSDALRAMEDMEGPLMKQAAPTEQSMKVTLKLTDEKKQIATGAMAEADIEPEFESIEDKRASY